MLFEIFNTVLPSLIVLILLIIGISIATDISRKSMLRATCFGIIVTIPAIVTMQFIGIILALTGSVSFLLLKIISVLNEESFKFLSIKLLKSNERKILSIFTGTGFSICETLYLSLGIIETSFLRSYTALPLHIITSLILSRAFDRKIYFILAVLIHGAYNYALYIL